MRRKIVGKEINSERGAALLLLVVAALVFVGILLPHLMRILRHESVQEVRTVRLHEARALATSAVDKIQWRLANDTDFLRNALTGSFMAGYADDATHGDLEGGEYKVKLSSGPGLREITLLVKARNLKGEMASVKVLLSQPVLDRAYLCPEINHMYWLPAWFASSFSEHQIHWSPIKVNKAIFNEMTWNLGFPRVFCTGAIVRTQYGIQGGVSATLIDQNPISPNSDGARYWAYTGENYLPHGVELDYDYYRARAKATVFPTNGPNITLKGINYDPLSAEPPGSGYFPRGLKRQAWFGSSVNVSQFPQYSFRSSTSVLFFENYDVSFADLTRGFLELEAMIGIDSNFEFKDRIPSFPDSLQFQATLPENANLEYAAAPGVWDDGSGASMKDAYDNPNHCCYTIPYLQFHGIIGGKRTRVRWAGGSVLGALVADSGYGVSGEENLPETNALPIRGLFYDPRATDGIHMLNAPTIVSWDEVNLPW